METNGHFLRLLNEDPLMQSIITNLDFAKIDLNGVKFKKEDEDTYSLTEIKIGKYVFKSVNISISPSINSIKLLTSDSSFFDNPILYFNQEGLLHETESVFEERVSHPNFRRKMGTFSICSKEARISIFKSTAYGCIIKLVFLT